MEDGRRRDQFRRIELMSQLEHDRGLIDVYEKGLAYFRTRIEDARYSLGKLDQRLGA